MQPMPLLNFPELKLNHSKQSILVDTFLSSVRIRGSFPSSLSLLESLFKDIEATNISSKDVALTLQVDQILSLRLIALVNMGYYNNSTPILTVSAAVDHFGLIKLQEILPSLADAKNFNAIFLGNAVALGMMQQAMLAAKLAAGLTQKICADSKLAEIAYLTTVISNIAPLMLAFHYPDIFSVLALSSQAGYLQFKDTLGHFIGQPVEKFAAWLTTEMYLPNLYVLLANSLNTPPWQTQQNTSLLKDQTTIINSTFAANMLAHEICNFTGIQGVQSIIRELEHQAGIDPQLIESVVADIGNVYLDQTNSLFLKAVRLPEYLLWFGEEVELASNRRWLEQMPNILQRINPFLYDLRACMRSSISGTEYPLFPQAVHLTLMSLIKGLNFDRAVFFKVDEQNNLKVGITVGVKLFEPDNFTHAIKLNDLVDPIAQILANKQAVFSGEPIFTEGWPFAAFPAIWKNKVIGIFYADRIRRPDLNSLTNQEQIACNALAEEWKDLPSNFI